MILSGFLRTLISTNIILFFNLFYKISFLIQSNHANWTIRCTEDYLLPVVECLRQQLLAREMIHCDETPVQVLKETVKKPQTKSYM